MRSTSRDVCLTGVCFSNCPAVTIMPMPVNERNERWAQSNRAQSIQTLFDCSATWLRQSGWQYLLVESNGRYSWPVTNRKSQWSAFGAQMFEWQSMTVNGQQWAKSEPPLSPNTISKAKMFIIRKQTLFTQLIVYLFKNTTQCLSKWVLKSQTQFSWDFTLSVSFNTFFNGKHFYGNIVFSEGIGFRLRLQSQRFLLNCLPKI